MKLVLWLEDLYIQWSSRSKVLNSPCPQNGVLVLKEIRCFIHNIHITVPSHKNGLMIYEISLSLRKKHSLIPWNFHDRKTKIFCQKD